MYSGVRSSRWKQSFHLRSAESESTPLPCCVILPSAPHISVLVVSFLTRMMYPLSSSACARGGGGLQNWNKDTGFTISREEQIAYNEWFVLMVSTASHSKGLVIGCPSWVPSALTRPKFINEYGACS